MFLKRPQGLAQRRIALIVDDAAARARRDVQKGHIDEALEIARRPGSMFETWKRAEHLDHTRAGAVQRNARGLRGLGHIQFHIGIAVRGADRRQLMQEATIELSRLDLELFARQLIDDADAHSGAANTIAQLRG